MDSRRSYENCAFRNTSHMRFVPCISPADSQTSQTDTYVRHAETRILPASHGKRLTCHCRTMYELRQERKSIQTYSIAQCFPSYGPLEFVALDILRQLPKITQGNQDAIVMTDKYSKLSRAGPTAKTSATQVANIFLVYWIIPFGIPSYLLTGNGPQFLSRVFQLSVDTYASNI